MTAQQTEVGLDLIVIDLDAERQEAMSVLPLLMGSATKTEVPLIALAQHERDRAAAAVVGVREVLGTPPIFGEVRSAVIHALSSPAAFTVT